MPAKIVFVLADSRASEPPTRLRCQVVAVGISLPAAAHVNRLGFDLLGGFGRRNEVARDLTDEIEKHLTGFDLGC